MTRTEQEGRAHARLLEELAGPENVEAARVRAKLERISNRLEELERVTVRRARYALGGVGLLTAVERGELKTLANLAEQLGEAGEILADTIRQLLAADERFRRSA